MGDADLGSLCRRRRPVEGVALMKEVIDGLNGS